TGTRSYWQPFRFNAIRTRTRPSFARDRRASSPSPDPVRRAGEIRSADPRPCGFEPLGRADVDPEPVVAEPAKGAARDRRVEDRLQRPASGREPGEEARMEQRDDGVRQPLAAIRHAAARIDREIA